MIILSLIPKSSIKYHSSIVSVVFKHILGKLMHKDEFAIVIKQWVACVL